jgi:hypothetical protein
MTDLQAIDMMYKHEHESKTKTYSIDIETFTLGKEANEYTDSKSYKLGNVKDPMKIEAALVQKRSDARRKHALSWWTGKIISVAVVDVFGDESDECYAGHAEAEVLKELANKLAKPCKLVGKSSDMFDYGFIKGRYMANRLNIPAVFKQPHNLYDCDKFLSWSSQSSQRGSLSDYAHGIGAKEKPMKGSDVHDLYSRIMIAEGTDAIETAKLWDELIAYNINDSVIVAELTRLYAGTDRRL